MSSGADDGGEGGVDAGVFMGSEGRGAIIRAAAAQSLELPQHP